eukprot:COSAG02_NODE_47397_length_341_cov_0.979339_1_plen_78_part_10
MGTYRSRTNVNDSQPAGGCCGCCSAAVTGALKCVRNEGNEQCTRFKRWLGVVLHFLTVDLLVEMPRPFPVRYQIIVPL